MMAPSIVPCKNARWVPRFMRPAGEKITLVLEAIGDDKIRVNSSSLDHALVILPDLRSGRTMAARCGPSQTITCDAHSQGTVTTSHSRQSHVALRCDTVTSSPDRSRPRSDRSDR